MAKKTKLSFKFDREIKPQPKPEHLIVSKMSANVEVICDFENEMAAQRIKLLEKDIEKEGKGILDRYEKMINEKLAGFDELIRKQRKLADKGVPNAEKPVAQELKDTNKLLKNVQNSLGGEMRTSIENLIKKQKIKAKSSSVGRNLFREVKLEPGLFEGIDDGLDAKEVAGWTDIFKAWVKDAKVLSTQGGPGTLDDEVSRRGDLYDAFKALRNPGLDEKERASVTKDAALALKGYAASNAKYQSRLKKTLKQLDANLAFIKKQKNEVEKGFNKQVASLFTEVKKQAEEIEANVVAGVAIARGLAKSLGGSDEGGPDETKKLRESLRKGAFDNGDAITKIEKLQGDINKLFRKATAKSR